MEVGDEIWNWEDLLSGDRFQDLDGTYWSYRGEGIAIEIDGYREENLVEWGSSPLGILIRAGNLRQSAKNL